MATVRLLLSEPRSVLTERVTAKMSVPQNWIRLCVNPSSVAKSESEVDATHEVTFSYHEFTKEMVTMTLIAAWHGENWQGLQTGRRPSAHKKTNCSKIHRKPQGISSDRRFYRKGCLVIEVACAYQLILFCVPAAYHPRPRGKRYHMTSRCLWFGTAHSFPMGTSHSQSHSHY